MRAPTPTSPRPPRGELFADAGAAAVWAAIQILSEPARRELLDHLIAATLVPELRSSPKDAQLARAIQALREAHELLLDERATPETGLTPSAPGTGEPPRLSVPAYESLRRAHGRRLGWPPEASVRRWFAGTWNDCLRAAGLDLVPDGDAVVRKLGGAFSREEVLTAVHACAQDLDEPIPTLTGYLRWARRADVRRRPGRRPLAQNVFERLFGGWPATLVSAGLIEPDPIGGVGHSRTTTGGGRTVHSRSGFAYTDEQLREALREIARRLGRSPKTQEYRRERERLLEDQLAAGSPPHAFPSLSMQQKRFATWDEVLTDAGLAPVAGRQNPAPSDARRGPLPLNDETMTAALREAFDTIGHPFTSTAYKQWRTVQTARDQAEGRFRRIPSYHPIQARYGTWADACATALNDQEPDTGSDQPPATGTAP